jgi:hypothetical protein
MAALKPHCWHWTLATGICWAPHRCAPPRPGAVDSRRCAIARRAWRRCRAAGQPPGCASRVPLSRRPGGVTLPRAARAKRVMLGCRPVNERLELTRWQPIQTQRSRSSRSPRRPLPSRRSRRPRDRRARSATWLSLRNDRCGLGVPARGFRKVAAPATMPWLPVAVGAGVLSRGQQPAATPIRAWQPTTPPTPSRSPPTTSSRSFARCRPSERHGLPARRLVPDSR